MVVVHYVDADVEVRESGAEGLGVFARRSFSDGDTIRFVNVRREITDESPLRPDLDERVEHCAYPDGKVVLYGVPDRYFNHSCDPNAWERYIDGRPEIVARRAIHAGEEIRVDYLVNNGGASSWPCSCGASRCRGMTSVSFFTLPREQQREYLPLLADWFVARHADAMAELRHQLGVHD